MPALLFDPEDVDNTFLRNVGKFLSNYLKIIFFTFSAVTTSAPILAQLNSSTLKMGTGRSSETSVSFYRTTCGNVVGDTTLRCYRCGKPLIQHIPTLLA
jgi:hypothetical protein